MKNIMLLGDSIRMHYQDEVIKNLGDEYQVFKPGGNCRFARYTLNSLRYWLDECPNPDIIHWNNGLWDTAVLYKEDGCFTPIDEYICDDYIHPTKAGDIALGKAVADIIKSV